MTCLKFAGRNAWISTKFSPSLEINIGKIYSKFQGCSLLYFLDAGKSFGDECSIGQWSLRESIKACARHVPDGTRITQYKNYTNHGYWWKYCRKNIRFLINVYSLSKIQEPLMVMQVQISQISEQKYLRNVQNILNFISYYIWNNRVL